MGILDRFKKNRLSKDQRKVLEKAREELKKSKEHLKNAEDEDRKRFDESKKIEPQLKKQIEEVKDRMKNHLKEEQEDFNKFTENVKQPEKEDIEKNCNYCKKELVWPDINSCYYCQKNYCGEHRLAENHECPKVMAAKHIETDYLRKKGVNITTARFAVICKNCGFESEYEDIEKVNQIRIDHIKQSHCKSEMVKLRQHDDDKEDDEEFIQKTYPTNQGNTWMYGCLEEAKQIIKNNHNAEGISEFFSEANFSIFVQTDMENAYGYINGNFPFYRIGIHQALEENTPESYKMVTVVLIHEILHALHDDWSESQVSGEENRLANLGLHFDAIRNLDVLYLSGKMKLCKE